jgi:hypothetical protein
MIDRKNGGRFIASIPDLGELAAYGHSDKDSVAHVTELGTNMCERVEMTANPFPRVVTSPRCRAISDRRRSGAR